MRRKPLLASRGLVTREPLSQGTTDLAAHAPLAQRQPLRSNPENDYNQEFKKQQRLVALRSGGRCEVRVYSVCTGFAQHTHHRKLRSQGGDNGLENLINVCISCHDYVHTHKPWAYEQGWLVQRDKEVTEIIPFIPLTAPYEIVNT